MSEATTTLQFSPTAVKMVENKAAVTVGTTALSKKENENGICEAEARVRAFMRMLRVKEGTEGEEGYKTLFTHAQFSDMSKHPQKVMTSNNGLKSSAAGAYQIMTDTWKNLTGNYQDSKKIWHYSEKLDYTKKYNITSFDHESQDKFCLVIMKHNYLTDRSNSFYNPVFWKDNAKTLHDTERETKVKEWRKRFKGQQGDIIQFVIDNDIKRAALLASLAWASLPDSPYGQQSPSYTFENVKAIYEGYLKEELVSPSEELYLKKGFLKEFNYNCCNNESSSETGSCNKCNQNHYDVAKSEHWVHQKPHQCWQASIDILANYGLKNNSGYPKNRIIMADQSGNKLIPKDTQKAIDYINSQLKVGNPIVVGLDDNLRQETYNSHKATEHFFVIVGKGCDEGKLFYRFFDVGAHSRELGTGINSKLYLLDNGLLQGKSAGGSHNYTVTEVRRNN